MKKFSEWFVIFLIALAIFLGYSTFASPISSIAIREIVYTRNLVTVVAWLLIARFLTYWRNISYFGQEDTKTMKKFSILTLAIAIVCIIKSFLALLNLLLYINNDRLILLYFSGEAIAWICLSVFFTAYYVNHKEKKKF